MEKDSSVALAQAMFCAPSHSGSYKMSQIPQLVHICVYIYTVRLTDRMLSWTSGAAEDRYTIYTFILLVQTLKLPVGPHLLAPADVKVLTPSR